MRGFFLIYPPGPGRDGGGEIIEGEIWIRERQLHLDGHGVEPLETEDEFIEEKPGLLVKGTNEGVPLIKPKQNIHAPLQLGKPYVQTGHAGMKKKKGRECKKDDLLNFS